VATDNRFDAAWVFERWRIIHRGCERYELRLAGHISDGDSRLRKNDFGISNATNASGQSWYTSHYFLEHSLLMLSIPTTVEGHAIFGHQDYMHLAWRLRVQLLSPKKEWEIGPGLRIGVAHLDSLRNADGSKMLNGKDLDPHNKQHWPGVVKMFSRKVSDELKQRIDAGELHLKATYAIILIFSAYLDSWLCDRNDERVNAAGFNRLPEPKPTCLRAYVPTCLCAYVPTCLRAYVPTCLRALRALRAYAYAYAYAYEPTPTCLRAYVPTCLRAYVPKCLRLRLAYAYAYAYTYTYA
jgi:hypothetical protein